LIQINGRFSAAGDDAGVSRPDRDAASADRSRRHPARTNVENVMRVIALIVAGCALSATLSAQIPDFTPQTPLIGSLLHNDSAEAKRLLEHGADPNEGGFAGMPPLFLATARGNVELVRLMIASGATIDVRDRSGSTALMWAAFNESGDAALVEALLGLGADPMLANRSGETALDWASRRGETPAVAALRRAGASETATVRTSVDKAVALLQKSSSQFSRVAGCYSCHHQSLPQMAFGIARSRGVHVDEEAAQQQIAVAAGVLKRVSEAALANRDRIPDPPLSVSYALLGLSASHYEADALTDAMTRVIAAWQHDDGAFHPLPPMRPPLEASTFSATALSLRALQLYGTKQDERVARAARWLAAATPRSTEDRAMQLLGLAWAQAPADQIRKATLDLLAEQRQDGGWSQLPALETDAYATGQALVALQTAGHAASSPEYRRGVAYLLRTQFPDGSWLVRSRTFPVQPPRDSGFPHGKDQWISAAGTSWATMALTLALAPEQAAETIR
jgi:ankyrin repeat protein